MSFEQVFDEMEISADPFAVCELNGRGTLSLGKQAGATLHYFLGGQGTLTIQGSPPLDVTPGTFVLIPALFTHSLKAEGAPVGTVLPSCNPAELKLDRHVLDDPVGAKDKAQLLALCSRVEIGLRGSRGLVDLIREPIVEQVCNDATLTGPVERLVDELAAPGIGTKAMVRALLLQCILQILRGRIEARDPRLNWMAALVDEGLWAALRTMLDTPGDPHTVESLADAAGMSRATFARRFAVAYGSGPMELLRDLRMRLASSLLARSDLPVKRIAELVGFESRSAFTRAFTATTGVSPREFRAKPEKKHSE